MDKGTAAKKKKSKALLASSISSLLNAREQNSLKK